MDGDGKSPGLDRVQSFLPRLEAGTTWTSRAGEERKKREAFAFHWSLSGHGFDGGDRSVAAFVK